MTSQRAINYTLLETNITGAKAELENKITLAIHSFIEWQERKPTSTNFHKGILQRKFITNERSEDCRWLWRQCKRKSKHRTNKRWKLVDKETSPAIDEWIETILMKIVICQDPFEIRRRIQEKIELRAFLCHSFINNFSRRASEANF